MNEIEDILRKRVEGEVRFDQYTRTLYSTDASIYDITPIGVVLPKSEQDVVEVHKVAHERKVAVLPRGGGSSLSGQAIGDAVILDFTRYLSRIVEINPEEKWARVQPGVTLDDLNRALKPHGLKFGPDPASGSRAAIGGMIGNNSTGAHSIIYGMTSDHVLSLKVAFANGEVAVLEQEPRDGAEPPDHQEGGFFASPSTVANLCGSSSIRPPSASDANALARIFRASLRRKTLICPLTIITMPNPAPYSASRTSAS